MKCPQLIDPGAPVFFEDLWSNGRREVSTLEELHIEIIQSCIGNWSPVEGQIPRLALLGENSLLVPTGHPTSGPCTNPHLTLIADRWVPTRRHDADSHIVSIDLTFFDSQGWDG